MDNVGQLNEFLQPVGSLPAKPPILGEGRADNVSFLGKFARNSVVPSRIAYLPVDKIGAGTIVVSFNLGTTSSNGYMILDGGNNRILLNDGTTNRIVIGNV